MDFIVSICSDGSGIPDRYPFPAGKLSLQIAVDLFGTADAERPAPDMTGHAEGQRVAIGDADSQRLFRRRREFPRRRLVVGVRHIKVDLIHPAETSADVTAHRVDHDGPGVRFASGLCKGIQLVALDLQNRLDTQNRCDSGRRRRNRPPFFRYFSVSTII